MKLATWNVNSLSVRLPQVLDWLAAQQPEVLVLQETKLIIGCASLVHVGRAECVTPESVTSIPA